MKTDTHFLSYLPQFFLEWILFQVEFVETLETHIICSITPAPNIVPFMGYVAKCCRAG